ncbi:effector-associated constant component EACC1 [Microbispora rosea]
MDVALSFASTHTRSDLEDLFDWLRDEKELRGRVRLGGVPPKSGEMGSAMEVVLVAVGSGGFLTVLATSLQTWLAQPRKSSIKIRARNEAGLEIEIDAHNINEGKIRELLDGLSSKPE